jgi:mannan polymerase complexes MNN9 subunit
VVFEGYQIYPTQRKNLNYITEGEIIELDGVGGTVLLIRADLHREGVIFPPFAYQHTLETEGLAKVAKAMGYQAWGLVKYEIVH